MMANPFVRRLVNTTTKTTIPTTTAINTNKTHATVGAGAPEIF